MLRRKLHSGIFKTKKSQPCKTGVLVAYFRRTETKARPAQNASRVRKNIIAGVKVAGKGFLLHARA